MRPAGRVGTGQSEDQRDQTCGGDNLANQMPTSNPMLSRQVLADIEHDIGQYRPEDSAGTLRDRVRANLRQRETCAEAATENPVRERDQRVEVRAGHRAEHEDEYREAERRGRAVLQQLQAGLARRELLSGNARADDDGDEQTGSQESANSRRAKTGDAVHADILTDLT